MSAMFESTLRAFPTFLDTLDPYSSPFELRTLRQHEDSETLLDPVRKSNVTECVAVPSSEHVAEIVGRQGCRIKLLRQKTGTYIKTPGRGEPPNFLITGRREDVAQAKTEIVRMADHFTQIRAVRRNGLTPPALPGSITLKVRVPYRVVGLVVGPKGATIKRIQHQTSTYILTPSRDKEPVFEVTGYPANAKQAKQEILNHIAVRTGTMLDGMSTSDGEDASSPTYAMPNFPGMQNTLSSAETLEDYDFPSQDGFLTYDLLSSEPFAKPSGRVWDRYSEPMMAGLPKHFGALHISSSSDDIFSTTWSEQTASYDWSYNNAQAKMEKAVGAGVLPFRRATIGSSAVDEIQDYNLRKMWSDSLLFDLHLVKKSSSEGQKDNSSPSVSDTDSSNEFGERENPDALMGKLCASCDKDLIDAALIPCGHAFCTKCAYEMSETDKFCQKCSQAVTKALRIFC